MPSKICSSLTDEQLIEYYKKKYKEIINYELSAPLIEMTKIIIKQVEEEIKNRGLNHAML